MSTLKVDGIRSNSASSDAITLAGDGTCTANITNRSNRNLIINGAMQVAQRGTSSTDQNYGAIDRFKIIYSGTDEAPTHSQVDVAAGTTPYTLGFRKAYKITNGNQTGGAGDGDRIELQTNLEGQDLAQSGWNYVSSSSNITLSFWIKSSVAQTFASRLQTQTAGANGSQQRFKFNFALSADTWTKVTKTIPGNANLAFATDNQNGFRISFFGFMGTNYTDSTTATDVWADNTGGDRADDMTSTWFTTNDATLEITGVQLEVGSVATDFEHRSYGDELARCQRYFQTLGGTAAHELFMVATGNGTGTVTGFYKAPVTFRAVPSYSYSALGDLNIYDFSASADRGSPTNSYLVTSISGKDWIYIDSSGMSATTAGVTHMFRADNTTNARFNLDAEL